MGRARTRRWWGYRGSALAELFRALSALRLLQAEARSEADLPSAAGAAERAPITLPSAPSERTEASFQER